MKKLIISLVVVGLMVLTVSPVMAAPATPSQCSGMTFDHTIVSTKYGNKVIGTSGRDLIFVTGGSSVSGLGGADCIVTSQGGNSINAGAGNDKVVFQGWGNFANGGAGSNHCYLSGGDKTINCINH